MSESTISRPVAGATYASLAAGLAEQLARVVTAADDRISRAADELRAGLPAEPDPRHVARLHRLVVGLGLSAFERDVAVLAGLPHEHETLAEAFTQLHPRGVPCPTPAIVTALLCRGPSERAPVRQALIDGPLISSGLLRLDPGPFFSRPIELADGSWPALHGFDRWPDALQADEPRTLLGLAGWRDQPDVALAVAALGSDSRTGDGRSSVVVVTAADADDARSRAGMVIRWASRRPRQLRGELSDPAVAAQAGLQCVIRGELPLLAAADLDPDTDPLPTFPGPIVVYRQPDQPITCRQRPLIQVRVAAAELDERAAFWSALLPGEPEVARTLAALHRIDPLRAVEATADARAVVALSGDPAAAATSPTAELLSRAVLARAVDRLPASVRLVRPSADPDGLVLDPRTLAVLDAAVQRAQQQVRVLNEWGLRRGRRGAGGVRLLFTGPPGTGKTYTAEVLAARLALDLLVVDLSALVSKWLGETEKNLAEVFDAAERTQAVLFFDEADAIFARRTETSDAHARWANLETAYLLSRIEAFDGVTILATNLRANIDTAFLRRLEFVVTFDEPDITAREQLWRDQLREPAPIAAELDYRMIAQLYPITGGLIRNAALAAAFLAAVNGGVITRDHVFTAIQREYEKAGRSFPGRPR